MCLGASLPVATCFNFAGFLQLSGHGLTFVHIMMAAGVGGSWALIELGVVLFGLLAAALWLRRRIEGRQGAGSTRLAQLTPEHAVHLVEVRGCVLVLATGPGGPATVLREFPAEPSADSQLVAEPIAAEPKPRVVATQAELDRVG